MIIIYILLIIIAVGVLLASEAGKELLGWLIKLAIFAGCAYLGFWIIVIVFGLLSPLFADKNARDNTFAVIGIFAFICYGIYGIYLAYKNLKTKEKRAEVWKGFRTWIKKFFIEMWEKHKVVSIFLILSFLFISFSIVFLS
jgi:hypothetical protein